MKRWQIVVYVLPTIMYMINFIFNNYRDVYYLHARNFDVNTLALGSALNGALTVLVGPLVAFHSDKMVAKGNRRQILVLSLTLYCLMSIPCYVLPSGFSDAGLGFYLTVLFFLRSLLLMWFDLVWNALATNMCVDYEERTIIFSVENWIGSFAASVGYIIVGYIDLDDFPAYIALVNFMLWAAYMLAAFLLTRPDDSKDDVKLEPPEAEPLAANREGAGSSSSSSSQAGEAAVALEDRKKPQSTATSEKNKNSEDEEEEAEEEEEEGNHPDEPIAPFVPTLIRCLRNQPFMNLLMLQVLIWAYLVSPSENLMRYYAFNASQQAIAWTGVVTEVVLIAVGPLMMWLAKRLGKRDMICFLLGGYCIVVASSVAFVKTADSWLYWYLQIGSAIFGEGQHAYIIAMLADVVDYDQLLWGGGKRAGVYYAFLHGGQSFEVVFQGIRYSVLGSVGFRHGEDASNPLVQRTIRWMAVVSILPATLAVLMMLREYGLDKTTHKKIVEAKSERFVSHTATANSDSNIIVLDSSETIHTNSTEQDQDTYPNNIVNPITNILLPQYNKHALRAVLDHFSLGELTLLLLHGPKVFARRVAMHTVGCLAVVVACGGFLFQVGLDSYWAAMLVTLGTMTAGLLVVALVRLKAVPEAQQLGPHIVRTHLLYVASTICDSTAIRQVSSLESKVFRRLSTPFANVNKQVQ